MTVAATARGRRSRVFERNARSTATALDGRRARLRMICSVGLMLGAGVHLNVGITHAGSNFGTLSLLAAAAQLALGIVIYMRSAAVVANAVVLLSLVIFEIYLMNVTVGLPPAIAHVHSEGTHELWGYTLALPNAIDLEGVTAVLTEVVSAATAALLVRAGTVGQRP